MPKASNRGRGPGSLQLRAALRQKFWTYRDGAARIGMSERRLAALARGEQAPRRLTPEQQLAILDLTGNMPEDLWPAYGRRNGITPLQGPKAPKFSAELLMSRGALQPMTTPDELLERRGVEGAFQRSLLRLKPQQARVARLSLLEGATHSAIGQELGLARVSVVAIAAAAKRKLRRAPELAESRPKSTPRRQQ